MNLEFKTAFLFGDSIAKGIVFDDKAGKYTSITENFANTVSNLLGISLFNKAKFGCTIKKGQDVIVRTVEIFEAEKLFDYAILEFGGNDCDYNWGEIAKEPDSIHLPNTPLNEFVNIYKQIVSYLNLHNIIPILLTLPPIASDYYYNWISKNKNDKDNILKWLNGNIENIYYWQERYNSAVWEVATSTNSRVVDVRRAFLEVKDYKKYLCCDGIHLNKQGHLLASGIILESVESFLIAY